MYKISNCVTFLEEGCILAVQSHFIIVLVGQASTSLCLDISIFTCNIDELLHISHMYSHVVLLL